MKKVSVIVLGVLLLVGCDGKKALEIKSTDTYESIAAKTKLQDKKDDENYYLYTSKDKLKSFDNIPFNQDYGDMFFMFSKDGKLCSLGMSVDTLRGASSDNIFKLSSETRKILEKYSSHAPSDSQDFLTWKLNNTTGIREIRTGFMSNKEGSIVMLDIDTDNKRYCDPEIMEREKKGKWIVNQSVDAIDDTITYNSSIFSTTDKDGLLSLLCKSNNLIISIYAGKYIGTRTSEVAFRLDKNKAIISDWVAAQNAKYVIYQGDTKEIFREMLKAKKLTARIKTLNSSVILRFDLDKIDYATKDIAEACNINDTDAIEKEEIPQGNTANQDGNQDNIAKAWTIQVAATSTRENAESFQRKLREHNYNAYIQLDNNVFRINVGPFIKKTEAFRMLGLIEKQFKEKGIIREYKPNRP